MSIDGGRDVPRPEGNTLFLEEFEGLLRNIFVLDGENPVEHLDNGDTAAHCVVEPGELHSDGAASNDDEPFGATRRGHGIL